MLPTDKQRVVIRMRKWEQSMTKDRTYHILAEGYFRGSRSKRTTRYLGSLKEKFLMNAKVRDNFCFRILRIVKERGWLEHIVIYPETEELFKFHACLSKHKGKL